MKRILASVIIPSYNGRDFLKGVLQSLDRQSVHCFEVLVVDNGSNDGSPEYVHETFPQVKVVRLDHNTGFARAVNEGIRHSSAPYVILLNNDTEADPRFVEEMIRCIRRHKKAFSCSARMIRFKKRDTLDGAGDAYCVLGWAYARGKGKSIHAYEREEQVFSSCAGAAIYRREPLVGLGCFDEKHFAYLEDLDVGYRARIYGWENWYAPRAVVYHVGSGTSGSRYNAFKTRCSARNSVYLIHKNMPLLQIIINLPWLILGFGIKLAFFAGKGLGGEYISGIKRGLKLSRQGRKVPFNPANLMNYLKIQQELWLNLFARFKRIRQE